MGLFSVFKKKQAFILYKHLKVEAVFSEGYTEKFLELEYVRLDIFVDPGRGFGDKFEESFNLSEVEIIQVSSDLSDLIRTANYINNIEEEKIKTKLSNFFGTYAPLSEILTAECDRPDNMFPTFETLISSYS